MAMTPEKKVKDRVVKQLKLFGDSVYYFFPATGGYGRSGVPDIVGCFNGKFWAIECLESFCSLVGGRVFVVTYPISQWQVDRCHARKQPQRTQGLSSELIFPHCSPRVSTPKKLRDS
jgi:hypothetical protein